MPGAKIQFREDPELIAFVASRGLNPNEVARQAFEQEVRRMKGEDWLSRLREMQKTWKPWPATGAEMARESRRDLEGRQ